MVRVTVLASGEGVEETVGDFEFEHLPRQGEDISVPSAGAIDDLRIFTVGAVTHVAAGAGAIGFGPGPRTLLHCDETH